MAKYKNRLIMGYYWTRLKRNMKRWLLKHNRLSARFGRTVLKLWGSMWLILNMCCNCKSVDTIFGLTLMAIVSTKVGKKS